MNFITYVQLHAPIPEKNIYFNDFSASSDDASIFKEPRIDAGSEPEIPIKLIENYLLKCIFLTSKKYRKSLHKDACTEAQKLEY